jgi:hypothetical protein
MIKWNTKEAVKKMKNWHNFCRNLEITMDFVHYCSASGTINVLSFCAILIPLFFYKYNKSLFSNELFFCQRPEERQLNSTLKRKKKMKIAPLAVVSTDPTSSAVPTEEESVPAKSDDVKRCKYRI